jgi:hypothetical protein
MVVTLSCSFNFKANPNSLKKNTFDKDNKQNAHALGEDTLK